MGSNGQYIPMTGRAGPPAPPLPTHAHPVEPLSGNVDPEGAVPANPGTKYVNLVSKDQFLKINGVQKTGWEKVGVDCGCVSAGSTGPVQVYIGRNPNPPDDISVAALNYPNGGGTLTQWDPVSQTWV